MIAVLLTEWFRRRRGRLQRVQLIERVNRLVEPTEGFALARMVKEGPKGSSQWVPVEGVREYEFTLRNNTDVHLKDAEIQFEFSVPEVEGRATRPHISKTTLEIVTSVVNEPWKSGHRWKIPYLPPKDSIEFSFKAINCPSEEFEAVLFSADRVVISKIQGEPTQGVGRGTVIAPNVTSGFIVVFILVSVIYLALRSGGIRRVAAQVEGAGCSFTIVSSYESQVSNAWGLPRGPWEIFNYITNTGKQECVLQRPGSAIKTLEPGRVDLDEEYSDAKPKLIESQISFGVVSPSTKANAKFYTGN